jgi:FkbM family methyltransferase
MWEMAETRFLLATLRPGDTFVDVGAHVGYFTVLAARRVGATGQVIAVEPEARNLELLRANLARNGCKNAHVLPCAAGATPGWMSLHFDEENRGGHRLVPLGEADTRVRCVRLDDELPARVDVIKIDAQGYDHEIVDGLQGTLAANPHLVLLAELSLSELGRRRVAPDAVLSRYRALGLTISTLDPDDKLRRTSAEALLARCQAGMLPADFSLVLQRVDANTTEGFPCPNAATGLELTELKDGLRVYEPNQRRVHELNSTAAVVFALCTGHNTAQKIVELVQETYGLSDPPTAEVEQCLDHLASEGLVI